MEQKPIIIGITGGSGSGKSSFIRDLRTAFSEDEMCIISLDDYYKPKEEQKRDKKGVVNYDRPNSLYLMDFIRDIRKLMQNEVVERKEYTFNNAEAESRLIVLKPAPVIIVEGLYIFHKKAIRQLIDLKVFVHAKPALKIIRRILRDGKERNYPLDDVLYRYERHVEPSFEQHIEKYREDCDIVINNNKNYTMGLEVLKAYIAHSLGLQK